MVKKCVCECVSARAPFARVQFRVFGEQIKPLEPQDKSDRQNEGGKEEKEEEETGRGGEERSSARALCGGGRGREEVFDQ